MGVDPVGSCVGQKGVRVQAVINELGDEKIDVIAYQEDPVEFIKSALSPAKEIQVKINVEQKIAEVTAPDDQLSLAIGKEGQNVRLAAKLTGYKIDIRGKSGTPKEVEAKEKAAQDEAKRALGVTEEKTEETKTAKETKEPKEKGTAEKLIATDNKSTQTDDQNKSQMEPPQDDAEPLIADAEENKEQEQAEEVAKMIQETSKPEKSDTAKVSQTEADAQTEAKAEDDNVGNTQSDGTKSEGA
jgi:N utilization substance protein A